MAGQIILIIMWWYVYILRSKKNDRIYIGSTNNLKRRIREHNQGLNKSTKPFIPWVIEASIAVKEERKARELEEYFKTGSGSSILRKRILSNKADD
ncbi:MAG: GIY-YIG nuclease family protein [Ignavibacteria bacterium]